MRRIWVKVDHWDKEIVTSAIEGGADGIMVPKGFSKKVKALGRIQTISEDGDLKPDKDVIFYTIRSQEDEEEIVKLSKKKRLILQCTDWTIIPMENLIAKGADVMAQVEDIEEAQTAFGILETGVNGILFKPADAISLKNILSSLHKEQEKISLETAKITKVSFAGMGDRVCIDTCTNMSAGEGALIGNSSRALFLIHSESIENPYVTPRPFRINAGPVHAYTRVPFGKTRYLSELNSGDQILIVSYSGNSHAATIGRVKIERRPLLMVSALFNDKQVTTILQNAETVRLVGPKGQPLSVVNLKPGDKILLAVEASARHFGHKIKETLIEK